MPILGAVVCEDNNVGGFVLGKTNLAESPLRWNVVGVRGEHNIVAGSDVRIEAHCLVLCVE
jgi:hypothetical protein